MQVLLWIARKKWTRFALIFKYIIKLQDHLFAKNVCYSILYEIIFKVATVKPEHAVISIKQSAVLKGHPFLVL